jgi:hypothetical protein
MVAFCNTVTFTLFWQMEKEDVKLLSPGHVTLLVQLSVELSADVALVKDGNVYKAAQLGPVQSMEKANPCPKPQLL